jgi:antitoxin HicB
MRTYTYTIQLEPDDGGGFNVYVPALPGCVTQGETFQEAVAMAQEAIQGYLEALAKQGEPIPEEPQPTRRVSVAICVASPAAA